MAVRDADIEDLARLVGLRLSQGDMVAVGMRRRIVVPTESVRVLLLASRLVIGTAIDGRPGLVKSEPPIVIVR